MQRQHQYPNDRDKPQDQLRQHQCLCRGWDHHAHHPGLADEPREHDWCSLDAMGGCYFPGGATVNALRQARTATWSQINSGGTTSSTTKNYLTLWFDHGVKPANASYAYVLLPNYTTAQVSSYAASPEMTILENSTNAQAVKDGHFR